MTAGEFAFLAIGLLLGTAAGAGLVEVLRSRPPAPRQVRVTIAPDSVPTRAPTLASDPFETTPAGPAPFGPGDRRLADRADEVVASGESDKGSRRSVPRVMVPIAIGRTVGSSDGGYGTDAIPYPGGSLGAALARASADGRRIAVGVAAGTTTAAEDGTDVRDERGGGMDDWTGRVERSSAASDAGTMGVAGAGDGATGPPTAEGAPAAAVEPAVQDASAMAAGPGPSGPCAELIVVAQDRCAVADRARETSNAAQDALRQAQRSYDEHHARAESADADADPRRVRAAKESAQAAFRAARDAGATRDAADAAAAAWLQEINRINGTARDGAARAARERGAANALVVVIERLSLEADAARIAAESAAEACLLAREAVADCQEAEARGRLEAVAPPVPSSYPEETPELELGAAAGGEPRILRILRGDGDALVRAATELGGDDLDARRQWQLQLARLSDAIVAQAIDASALDFPDEQPFFAPFTRLQRREIVSALASLGYRYDGLGGFDDGRVPSQRDLSLAVGYAGLDPMRIRRWPSEREMPDLLADTSVAADEYFAEAAGGMTLGELVAILGRRADGLTDLWNDWGRVRAVLLAVD